MTLLDKIEALGATTEHHAITPRKLADLLREIAIAAEGGIVTLIIDLNEGSKQFANTSEFSRVFESMQNGEPIPFRICVTYASGLKNFYYPTCVKQSYVSLHAKAGSCELKFSSDGSFTTSGTALW